MKSADGPLLVVDDNEMNRDMLSRRLSRRGYSVVTAEGGGRALDLIQERSYSLILLDIMMPDIDGIEVLKRVRQQYSSSDLPIIMATAKDESSDIVEALKLGANDYVTKPLDFPVVLARVETQLSLKRATDSLAEANARMRRDLEAAARVQHTLLPDLSPETENVTFAWRYRPCDELGGDSLNVFALDKTRFALYVLDVSGHGVQAALLSVAVSHALSAVLDKRVRCTPALVVSQLNQMFPMDAETSQFFTILYGVLDTSTQRLRYVSAGHPGPIRFSPPDSIAIGDTIGPPIGVDEDAVYEEVELHLQPGDRLYLHSDGIIEEANQEGEQFNMKRLCAVVVDAQNASLTDSVATLEDRVLSWGGGGRLGDDLSVLAAEIL